MGRALRARRVVTAAAYGGGSLGAAGAVLLGLVYGESKLARIRIPLTQQWTPAVDRIWKAPGVPPGRRPIVFAMLGDSSAAGYGVQRDHETPAARIAVGLSALARRPVRLVNVAVVGAQSAALADQVEQVLPELPDLAVVMIGVNDVTHRIGAAESVRHLSAALELLRAQSVPFVVGTCPDLGTIRPIPQPLRWIVRRMSRNLAAAQAVVVVQAGGHAVSLGDLLGPEFAERREYFSDDQFHPSATGYARAAEVLLPSAADALGLVTVSEPAGPFTSTRARPVLQAAARAASHPGSEVSPTSVDGAAAGRRGPWARLIRRRAGAPPLEQDDPQASLTGGSVAAAQIAEQPEDLQVEPDQRHEQAP